MGERYFKRFGRGVFTCVSCGRKTRENDTGGTELCLECFEIAGLDNMVNDNGYEPGSKEYEGARAECDLLLAALVKKGGNGEEVKKFNSFIWPPAKAGA